MVNIEIMSDNITLLINELIKDQKLAKYLTYNDKSPLSKKDIALPAKNLILSKIHPYPFDPIATTDESVELRVYYPHAAFDASGAVAQAVMYLDVVCAKSLWLVNDGKSAIRPLMIASLLQRLIVGKSIGTLGTVKFATMMHLNINAKYDAIRIEIADATIFGG